VLHHPDACDPVVMALNIAIFAQFDANAISQAVSGDFCISAFAVSPAYGHARTGHVVMSGSEDQQSAETAPDVQQPISGPESYFLTNAIQLIALQFFEIIVGRGRVSARIGEARIEKGLEQIVAYIIVSLHIRLPAPQPVPQLDPCNFPGEIASLAHLFVDAVAQQRRQEIMQTAFLHLEISAHKRLAEAEVAVAEDLSEESRVVNTQEEPGYPPANNKLAATNMEPDYSVGQPSIERL
jgi:hypothetical protein